MLKILNLPGDSKYKIYKLFFHVEILYLLLPGEFNVYNMTKRSV